MGAIGLAIAIVSFTTILAADEQHIGIIDFYGYSGLDLVQVQKLVPFHVGDAVPSRTARIAAETSLAEALDRQRVKINSVCCLPDGRTTLFVGIAAPGVAGPEFLPRPTGSAKLPASVLKLYDDAERLINEAVSKGVAREDDSKGYALSRSTLRLARYS